MRNVGRDHQVVTPAQVKNQIVALVRNGSHDLAMQNALDIFIMCIGSISGLMPKVSDAKLEQLKMEFHPEKVRKTLKDFPMLKQIAMEVGAAATLELISRKGEIN